MLLGEPVNGLILEQMLNIWEIPGRTIHIIYMRIVRNREGVG